MTKDLPKTQHHIPRFLMRGFAVERKKYNLYTTVYNKDKIFLPNLMGIGGERYFYTQPDENEIEFSLQKFEAEYAPFHERLIEGEFDPKTDLELAANLFAHCAIRSKILRMEIAMAMSDFWKLLSEAMSSKETMKSMIVGYLNENPDFINEEIKKRFPMAGDYSWVSDLIDSNPDILLGSLDMDSMSQGLDLLSSKIEDPKQFARDTQIKVLNETRSPEKRAQRFVDDGVRLVRFDGRVCALGDSMLFHTNANGRAVGGVAWDNSTVSTILPITPHLALVSAPFPVNYSKVNFLDSAIRSAFEFFCFPRREAFLEKRTRLIGNLAGDVVKRTLSDVFRGRLGLSAK